MSSNIKLGKEIVFQTFPDSFQVSTSIKCQQTETVKDRHDHILSRLAKYLPHGTT